MLVVSRVGANSQVGIMALLNKGVLLDKESTREEATRAFTTVIDSPLSCNETRACALNNRANIYSQKDNHDISINDRNEVLALSDTSPDRRFVALFGRGESYFACDKQRKTLVDMSAILDSIDISDTDKMFARIMRAVCYFYIGHISNATEELLTTLDLLYPRIHNSEIMAKLKDVEMYRHAGEFYKASACLCETEEMLGQDWVPVICLRIHRALISSESPADSAGQGVGRGRS